MKWLPGAYQYILPGAVPDGGISDSARRSGRSAAALREMKLKLAQEGLLIRNGKNLPAG